MWKSSNGGQQKIEQAGIELGLKKATKLKLEAKDFRSKNFWVKKKVGNKKFQGPTNVGLKKCYSKKIWVQKAKFF